MSPAMSIARYTEARCYRLRCRLLLEEVITLLGGTSSFGFVTAKTSAELDRAAALCTFQPLLDLVVANIRFVWILPPLEVDPVRKDGVGVEVRLMALSSSVSRRPVRVFVLKFVCARKIATDTTGITVSVSKAICAPCSTESRGVS